MLDAERILDSPTVKKITHKGEEDPVAAMDHLVGLSKIKNQMREMAARMQYELQEYEKTGKKLKKDRPSRIRPCICVSLDLREPEKRPVRES